MPNPIEAFQDLPPWGKIVAGVAAAGILVLAVITIRNKQSAATQPNVTTTGNLTSTNGATSVQSLLQGLGYDPTTGAALSTGQQTTIPAATTTTPAATTTPTPADTTTTTTPAGTTPATPTPTPTTQVAYNAATDPMAIGKYNAIKAWENKWGAAWDGPPGSYPSGWLPGNVPGAWDPNNLYFVIPLNSSGSGPGAAAKLSGAGPGNVTARAPLVSAFGPKPVPAATSRYVRI